jgi:hypothetical protein
MTPGYPYSDAVLDEWALIEATCDEVFEAKAWALALGTATRQAFDRFDAAVHAAEEARQRAEQAYADFLSIAETTRQAATLTAREFDRYDLEGLL